MLKITGGTALTAKERSLGLWSCQDNGLMGTERLIGFFIFCCYGRARRRRTRAGFFSFSSLYAFYVQIINTMIMDGNSILQQQQEVRSVDSLCRSRDTSSSQLVGSGFCICFWLRIYSAGCIVLHEHAFGW